MNRCENKIMNEQELVSSIKEKMPDFGISISDLKVPNAKFVQSYYLRILEDFDIIVDSLNKPSVMQQQQLTCPEAHLHVLPIMNFFAALDSIFKRFGVEDFSLSDLTDPETGPRRTFFFMRAMDALHTFADWKAQQVQSSVSELLQDKEGQNQLSTRRDELKEELNRCASERVHRDAHKEQLAGEIEMVKEMLVQLKKEDDAVQEDIGMTKDDVEKQRHLLSKLQVEKQKLEADVTKVKNQLVTSPEQLLAEKQRILEKSKEWELEVKRLQEVKQEKYRQKELYENFIQGQEERASKQNDICELQKRNGLLKKNLKNQHKKIQSCTESVNHLKMEIDKIKAKLSQVHEQKEDLCHQFEQKKTVNLQVIEDLDREYQLAKKEYDEKKKKVTQIMEKIVEISEDSQKRKEEVKKRNVWYEEQHYKRLAEQDAMLEVLWAKMDELYENL